MRLRKFLLPLAVAVLAVAAWINCQHADPNPSPVYWPSPSPGPSPHPVRPVSHHP